MRYYIGLEGCFKPYVRMTQRSKWVDPEAQAYLDSKSELETQLAVSMVDRPMFPGQTPLYVKLYVYHVHGYHNRDLDNEVKAILDAMQGIVFENDCWIDKIEASRIQSQTKRECEISIEVGECSA